MSGQSSAGTGAAAGRLFTVGIPVFNGRSLLRACLESVVGSDFPHDRYEVLLADDGSSEPETRAILAEYAQRFAGEPGFLRVIALGVNSGGAARPRNRILDEASGEYVFFVDADDTIGSQTLARVADALRSVPADWVALHQALVNGRVGAARVRQPMQEVQRSRAFSTLTVHKVFRRAEIERQGLRFDENLPSGQDITFAFAFILHASRFLMLGGYDYYYLTRHTGNPDEPPHLSRTANTPRRLIDKNHRILSAMLSELRASDLPLAERLDVLGNVALPRALIAQRYLVAIVKEGPRAGTRELRRLAELLRDPLVDQLDAATLRKAFTPEHLRLITSVDWKGLRDHLRQHGPPMTVLPRSTDRLLARARRLVDVGSGRARHQRLLKELAALRRSVKALQESQARLDADVRTALDLPKAEPRDPPAGRASTSA